MSHNQKRWAALILVVLAPLVVTAWATYYFNQSEHNLVRDPVEDDPELQPLIRAAEQEAKEKLKDHPARDELGFCHLYWQVKKSILKGKYGIDWHSPAELNPKTKFD